MYMHLLPQLFVNYDTEMPSNGHNNFRECALIFPPFLFGSFDLTLCVFGSVALHENLFQLVSQLFGVEHEKVKFRYSYLVHNIHYGIFGNYLSKFQAF